MGACLEGNVRSERMADILRSKEAIVSSVLAIVDYSAESDCDGGDELFTLKSVREITCCQPWSFGCQSQNSIQLPVVKKLIDAHEKS